LCKFTLRFCLGVWRGGEGKTLRVENMRKNGEIFQKKLKEWFFRE